MSHTATFSTDADSLSAVFAAWFAAHPEEVRLDVPLTICGDGVRLKAGPTEPPVVRMPTGSVEVALNAYQIQVLAEADGKVGEELLSFTLGATITATAAIEHDVATLSGATVDLRFEGERSEFIDGVLDNVIKQLIGRGQTWKLPQMERLLGLKATLERIGTQDGTLAMVVGMSCAPKSPDLAQVQLITPDASFEAHVTGSASDGLVQDVLDCVFRPITVSKSKGIDIKVASASATLSLTLKTPTLTFADGKITGSAGTTGSLHIDARAPFVHFHPTISVSPTVGLSVEPEVDHHGEHLGLRLSVPKQHFHIHVPGVPGIVEDVVDDVLSDVVNLVIKGLNKLLGKLTIPVFSLDNPYKTMGLDVDLSFGTVAVQGHDLVVRIDASAEV